MNGPDHYRAAEEALDGAEQEPVGSTYERYYLDKAQVHATLAVAAALADRYGDGRWVKAAGS